MNQMAPPGACQIALGWSALERTAESVKNQWNADPRSTVMGLMALRSIRGTTS